METDAMACEPIVQPSKDGDVLLKKTGSNPMQYSNVDSTLWMKLYGPSRHVDKIAVIPCCGHIT